MSRFFRSRPWTPACKPRQWPERCRVGPFQERHHFMIGLHRQELGRVALLFHADLRGAENGTAEGSQPKTITAVPVSRRGPAFHHPEQIPGRILLIWTGIFVALVVLAFLSKTSDTFSRVWAIGWYAGGYGVILAFRFGLAAMMRHWTRTEAIREHTCG